MGDVRMKKMLSVLLLAALLPLTVPAMAGERETTERIVAGNYTLCLPQSWAMEENREASGRVVLQDGDEPTRMVSIQYREAQEPIYAELDEANRKLFSYLLDSGTVTERYGLMTVAGCPAIWWSVRGTFAEGFDAQYMHLALILGATSSCSVAFSTLDANLSAQEEAFQSLLEGMETTDAPAVGYAELPAWDGLLDVHLSAEELRVQMEQVLFEPFEQAEHIGADGDPITLIRPKNGNALISFLGEFWSPAASMKPPPSGEGHALIFVSTTQALSDKQAVRSLVRILEMLGERYGEPEGLFPTDPEALEEAFAMYAGLTDIAWTYDNGLELTINKKQQQNGSTLDYVSFILSLPSHG